MLASDDLKTFVHIIQRIQPTLVVIIIIAPAMTPAAALPFSAVSPGVVSEGQTRRVIAAIAGIVVRVPIVSLLIEIWIAVAITRGVPTTVATVVVITVSTIPIA
jgi:hypothetical protein